MPTVKWSDKNVAYINAHQTEQIMPELGSVWLRLVVEIGQWIRKVVSK